MIHRTASAIERRTTRLDDPAMSHDIHRGRPRVRTTRQLFVAALLLCTASVYADGLVNFKGWDATPQAYFMTKAEHQEWATIQSDDEAHKFVESYLARRGPGFPAMLEVRVAAADKHLTVGKLPGSQTLRGKLVILL